MKVTAAELNPRLVYDLATADCVYYPCVGDPSFVLLSLLSY